MKSLFALLTFILFCPTLYWAQQSDPIEDVLNEYQQLIAEEHYEQALDLLIKKKLEFEDQPANRAKILLRMGDAYYTIGDAVSSTKYFTQALLVQNGLSDHERIIAYNVIGINYSSFEDSQKSIDAYRKAISIIPLARKETKQEYEWLYNNIALEFVKFEQTDSARYYHQRCLDIRKKGGNHLALGQSYNNLGSLHYSIEQNDSALYYFQLGLSFRKEAENYSETAILESEINIAKALIALHQTDEAERILNEQLRIAEEHHHVILEQRALEQLTELYTIQGKHAQALQSLQRYHAIDDSLFSTERRDEIIRVNELKKYAEKAMKDSLMLAEKTEMDLLKREQEEKVRRQKERTTFYIQIGLIVAVVLLGIIVFVIYRNFKNNKRFSEVLLLQKKKVEEQKDTLIHANQEITDSINYAKRIQSAILPSSDQMDSILGQHALFYEPKAIVAGDFYWVAKRDEFILFAAADCTGHGVPGALVSVVCSNALQQSIDVHGWRSPSKILKQTNLLVVDAFTKNQSMITDGMDISLCALDRERNVLHFSGAHNPLYILKTADDGSYTLTELKGSKRPIGPSDLPDEFEEHTVEVSAGDLIVSFTDGFADQFGGDKGKKYKYRPFKNYLSQIAHLSESEIKTALSTEFHQWKGKEEQVDDVCVLCVRV